MSDKRIETLQWVGDDRTGFLQLIDQTLLPNELRTIACHDVGTVWEAIRSLRVRGAPAIGIAAAYGICLGIQGVTSPDKERLARALDETAQFLATSRPTAVNLFWALDRMRSRGVERLSAVGSGTYSIERWSADLLEEARAIHDEDRRVCRAIGEHGATLLASGGGVLTHCNAGGLATSELGTALAAIYVAHERRVALHVYVDETRPLLQGARLTAWELQQAGVPATLICDSMAGLVMRERRVQRVIVGADRIAANGDVANKIGTYSVAVLAHAHGIPFYVAAPTSTFDLSLDTGAGIPIEERDGSEITQGWGRATAPTGIDVYNPAFDVTPAELVSAIVTERGVITPVNRVTVERNVR